MKELFRKLSGKTSHVLRPVASLLFFAVALWLLHHEFKSLKAADIADSFRGLPLWTVVVALLLTACNYVVLIGYDWLGEKSTTERGFSLGYFDESYLSHYDMALIYQGDKPIAFANVWRGANKHELSIDLMRYIPDSPQGVMEYLLIELMLYGHAEGYQWFNLGMAPLSGVESHRLGPLWNRVSNLMFRHGEHFYNFQGLRSYKDKFDPEWFPKYFASPGGFATAQMLANVSTLISGGVTKLLHRRPES